MKIEVSKEDIAHAERILLPEGSTFDLERRNFIKNFDTIDLKAVPGSGKTTALLAKLLILEKHMPFKDGSGILVLSHTNGAIEEVKKKIKDYCPRMFSEPNFVGTIQSFVDHFLAIPYFANKYHKKVLRIDNDIYIDRFFQKFPKNYRYGLEQKFGDSLVSFLLNIQVSNNCIVDIFSKKEKSIPATGRNTKTYKYLVEFKKESIEDGFLNYNDAYFLAAEYIHKYPSLTKILQKRFRYVFVDEMQDMDGHQYNLLEELFYGDGESESSYQRIGDVNQAIYSGDVKLDDIWKERENSLSLTGSHRLTTPLAEVVKVFGLNYLEIEGRSTASTLQPHIIVFDNPEEILSEFTSLIKKYELTDKDYPFCGICWTTHKTSVDKDKIRLQNYFPTFEKTQNRTQTRHPTLRDFLTYFSESKRPLAPINKNLLDIFVRILRLEERKDDKDRYFSRARFINTLKELNPQKHEEMKLCLYKHSLDVYKGKEILSEFKSYVCQFFEETIDIFKIGKLSSKSSDFLNSASSATRVCIKKEENRRNDNIYINNDVCVRIGTVHSAKGETHTATLYMESYYYNDGGKSYESQRLIKQFKGNRIEAKVGKRIKQSTKVAYVGFSRPTHLLCVAIHKDRFEKNVFGPNWKIIDLTES